MNQKDCQVFIGYRRVDEDDQRTAQFLFNYVESEFGEGSAFLDQETIPGGAAFPDFIPQKIKRSKVFIALIDRSWLAPANLDRLNNKDDWVRKELEVALECEMPIIPICLDRTVSHPSFDLLFPPNGLPPALEKLGDFNAIDAGAGKPHQLKRLISDLHQHGVRMTGTTKVAHVHDRYQDIVFRYVHPALAAILLNQFVGFSLNWFNLTDKDQLDCITLLMLACGVLVTLILSCVCVLIPWPSTGFGRFLASVSAILLGSMILLFASSAISLVAHWLGATSKIVAGRIPAILLIVSLVASIEEAFHHRVHGGPP